MDETKERPWAGVNRAWLDGKDIQFLPEGTDDWVDWTHTHCPNFGYSNAKWRVKPIVKADVVKDAVVCLDRRAGRLLFGTRSPNLRLTFDGETNKLKGAEVIEQEDVKELDLE